MNPWIEGFLQGCKPPFTGDPVEWLEEHFKIPFSARSKNFQRDQAPHLNDVIRCAVDLPHKKVIFTACTGAGKTTVLEAVCVFNVGVEHGPMLVVMQTDKDAKDWSESRYTPIVDACEVIQKYLPEDRDKRRKTEILWQHMAQFFTGPNISGLQAKSIRFCYGDEVWIWNKGMIREMIARHHDRWNQKTILVTQGWESSSDDPHDMDGHMDEGDDRRRGFFCPKCRHWQEYRWEQIKYDEILVPGTSRVDYNKTGKTARYVCENGDCRHEIKDTPRERREIAESGEYRAFNPHHKQGVVAFKCPAWAVWWIEWGELANEWIKANKAKQRGNNELLRQWTMKRAAKTWVLDSARITDDDVWALRDTSYRRGDCPIDPKWKNEKVDQMITLCADVGERMTHWSVQVWNEFGETWVIDYGTVLSPEDLLDLAGKLEYSVQGNGQKVKPSFGAIDSGDFTDRIYSVCKASNGFLYPTKGSGAGWGKEVIRESKIDGFDPLVLYTYIDFQVKSALYITRIAKKSPPLLHFPGDVSEDFLLGHCGQRIIESEKGRGRIWKKVSGDHFGDCTKLHLVCWYQIQQLLGQS